MIKSTLFGSFAAARQRGQFPALDAQNGSVHGNFCTIHKSNACANSDMWICANAIVAEIHTGIPPERADPPLRKLGRDRVSNSYVRCLR